jgi:hypothetical protein
MLSLKENFSDNQISHSATIQIKSIITSPVCTLEPLECFGRKVMISRLSALIFAVMATAFFGFSGALAQALDVTGAATSATAPATAASDHAKGAVDHAKGAIDQGKGALDHAKSAHESVKKAMPESK